jgi:hypothetical protein
MSCNNLREVPPLQKSRQQEDATHFDNLNRLPSEPSNPDGNVSLVAGHFDTSGRIEPNLGENSYQHGIMASTKDRHRAGQDRLLSGDQMPAGNTVQSSNFFRATSNGRLRAPSELSNSHGQYGERPAPVLEYDAQNAQWESDESLTASKRLSKAMPNMYY